MERLMSYKIGEVLAAIPNNELRDKALINAKKRLDAVCGDGLVSTAIQDAFIWKETPEGEHTWWSVYATAKLIESINRKSKIKKEGI
jgi:hypothetical protein